MDITVDNYVGIMDNYVGKIKKRRRESKGEIPLK